MAAPVKKYSRKAAGSKAALVSICQKVSSCPSLLQALLLIAGLACPVLSGEYERVASELCRAAHDHGKTRVAVLPFQNVGKKNALAGGVISEKLVTAVMERGELEVVERTLLASVLREQRLMHSGAVDAGSIKELGRILGVDALVAGTVMELKDGRFEVNSRLIDTQSARILGAAAAKVEKDWAESFFDDFSMEPALPRWGSFDIAGPAYGAEAGEPDCGRAAEDMDDLDRAILDIKARYWAGRLKDRDIERGSLKKNPGSEIRNELTRQEFYRVLHSHYDDPSMRRVTQSELQRLLETQKQIERVAEACGQSGA
jgi:TolB-like protein